MAVMRAGDNDEANELSRVPIVYSYLLSSILPRLVEGVIVWDRLYKMCIAVYHIYYYGA